MSDSPSEISTEPPNINEYHLLELVEIFERTQAYQGLRVTIATFFGTMNLSAAGLAFSLHNAWLFFIAAATLIFWMISDTYAKREMLPFYYRGLQLEKIYAPEGEHALLHTYIASVKSRRDLDKWLGKIATLPTHTERVNELRAVKFGFGGMWWALILISLIEIALGVVLYFYAGWR